MLLQDELKKALEDANFTREQYSFSGVDFTNTRGVAVFAQEEKLRNLSKGEMEAWQKKWRGELEAFFGVDQRLGRAAVQAKYTEWIDAVKKQDDFDALNVHLWNIINYSAGVANKAKSYLDKLSEASASISRNGAVCPCCGAKLPVEMTDELKAEIDKVRVYWEFASGFVKARLKDREKLYKLGKKLGLSFKKWWTKSIGGDVE